MTLYQKCAIYNASGGGHEVRYTHDQSDTHKPQALDCDVTGPNTTLTSTDVRRAILKHSRAAANSSVDRALRALDIRVVPFIEPGRGYPTGPRGRANMFYSTDEAGAYLHHISRSYDDLADGTFFVHGHVHGGYDAAVRTMDWTAASGVAPQTYFGTTRRRATRVPLSGGMPSALGVPVKDATRKPRAATTRTASSTRRGCPYGAGRGRGSPRPSKSWTRTRAAPTSTTRYLCQDCPRRTSSGTTARLRVRIPGNTGAAAPSRVTGTCSSGWKSTSASGAPDNSSLSHFDGEQASRRWRGGRRGDSGRTRRRRNRHALISAQVFMCEPCQTPRRDPDVRIPWSKAAGLEKGRVAAGEAIRTAASLPVVRQAVASLEQLLQ